MFVVYSSDSYEDDLCYDFVKSYDDNEKSVIKDVDCRKEIKSPLSPTIDNLRPKRERTWSLNKSTKSDIKSETVLRTEQRTIYTAGRPPWYDAHGQMFEPFIVGK